MTEEKLLSTFSLENGLAISFYDGSKKIAGDRWQVNLTARIQILTAQVHFAGMDSEKRSEILQGVGEKIYYEKKLIRNFVADKDKELIIKSLCESFLKINRPYFSKNQFPERFILKTYSESVEKRNLPKS